MQPELKEFIEKEFLPNFKKSLLTLNLEILCLEFAISEKEKELKQASQPIILDPKQIIEQSKKRAQLENEIEMIKKQKTEKEKFLEINQKFLEWIKEKIKI
jgi:hypothetical protein